MPARQLPSMAKAMLILKQARPAYSRIRRFNPSPPVVVPPFSGAVWVRAGTEVTASVRSAFCVNVNNEEVNFRKRKKTRQACYWARSCFRGTTTR